MRNLAVAFCLCAAMASAAAQPAGRDTLPADAFPTPDRPVASIVSPIWHSEDVRDAAKEVPQAVRLLGIEPGMMVADVGAGSGYYVTRLSPLLGPSGRIIAEDITPAYLRLLEAKVRDLHLTNVTVTAGEPADPKLPPHALDRALLVHMYHEVTNPFALLYNLAARLSPARRSASSMRSGRSLSTGRRHRFCAAKWNRLAIARRPSANWMGARPISLFSSCPLELPRTCRTRYAKTGRNKLAIENCQPLTISPRTRA